MPLFRCVALLLGRMAPLIPQKPSHGPNNMTLPWQNFPRLFAIV
jgi:hypothetical protein